MDCFSVQGGEQLLEVCESEEHPGYARLRIKEHVIQQLTLEDILANMDLLLFIVNVADSGKVGIISNSNEPDAGAYLSPSCFTAGFTDIVSQEKRNPCHELALHQISPLGYLLRVGESACNVVGESILHQ